MGAFYRYIQGCGVSKSKVRGEERKIKGKGENDGVGKGYDEREMN